MKGSINMGLMLNQVHMYEEDGGGSRKGFGIYASRNIEAGEISRCFTEP